MIMVILAVIIVGLLLAMAAQQHVAWSELEKFAAPPRQPARLRQIMDHDETARVGLDVGFYLVVALGAVLLPTLTQTASVVTPPTETSVAETEPSTAVDTPAPTFAALTTIAPVAALSLAVRVWLGLIALDLLIAKPLGRRFAEPVLYYAWPVINIIRILAMPVCWFQKAADVVYAQMFGLPVEDPPSPVYEEIKVVVNEAKREGTIKGDAAEGMIESFLHLPNQLVAEVMTPRTEMVMLRIDTPITEAADSITKHGHSRIPVYRETRDDVVGILYAKDLLVHLSDPAQRSLNLTSISLRTPLYVPETKPVDVLLREFQKKRIHIAIVLDEYGGVAGLLTIEDILEEIVGDIEDEHDLEELPEVIRLDERTFDLDARLRVDEVNELMPIGLPEDGEFETVGGFVFSTLGRLPDPGEGFDFHNARIVVIDTSDRKIKRLRIELSPNPASVDSGSS